ncbi:Bug family tripartite tricarboxylate transporter substrate binding protein [Parapusillimonas granuli]|uniref:Tripartite tricarboxylate transporter substrate binding protein n=1 Tax=Parapusillimonas granuli TaxID=380911 RepID=A0A853FY54_9BURK|nr:tripartite tricarboxylate transporter substrate binding protein [Parapusillimonas granuli]MBB5215525.1 tripartite-type tricarboxylate transporter receptor subunit TctC [Parapusillimonas granuli]MEB2401111.1 tripartite tricarboxylate transporter substrate binding protein [Alcaligenaceae bacterium]NYT49808.1 tripartite tricarboxylate transporter substrate binding protein [Parapusillimonas granuli]
MDRRTVLKLMGASGLAWHGAGLAQQKFPSRPITMMVGSTTGSATDLAARFSAQILQDKYKQSVVVENKPGAGGIICMLAVAAAAPDGYTLQTGGLGHNVIPPVTRTGIPVDLTKALIPIAQPAEFLNVLVVRSDHPARNLQEFIDYQKKKSQGGKSILYGSNGVGSSSHLASELFGIRTDLKVEHVPYKGASEALIGTANGDLDLLFMNMPPTLPMIQSGRLRALAVTSSYRARQLPDVPTMQEQGMTDFDVTSWLGVYGPAGMPQKLINELSDILVEGFNTEHYREKFIGAGFEPKTRNAQEFAAFSQSEIARWSEVAKKAGISIPYGG